MTKNRTVSEPATAGLLHIGESDLQGRADPEFGALLRSRRDQLMKKLAREPGQRRYFPVLSVLAPVMTQTEGEITYPGDPMCLYAALSVAVNRAVDDAGPLPAATHYNDLAPQWTARPSKRYRMTVSGDGIRPYPREPNTDQTVFDPRVWDTSTKAAWKRLLRQVQPRVVLISSVSPAHRYALEIAALAKKEAPRTFVVLGGRHVDETVVMAGTDVVHRPSSPLKVMAEDRIPHVVDAVVRGEAYFSLDLLMRALALSADLDEQWVDRAQLPRMLRCLAAREIPVARSAILLAAGAGPGPAACEPTPATDSTGAQVLTLEGPPVDLAALPSPYAAFAVRSRFPIFLDPDTGEVQRTAHVMVSNSCPYQCNFCSESSLLNKLNRFQTDATRHGVERVCEYVGYGAEALFFDDSIFWSGRYSDIAAFCEEMTEVRRCSWYSIAENYRRFFAEGQDVERLMNLQWGAQLTVDTISALHKNDKSATILALMKQAGCSYVYVGIESMSESVMHGVHKNLRRTVDRPWAVKVREAVALVKNAGLRVGTSVLFGLDGETRDSIDETIDAVGSLVDDGLVDLASPNILTYHPATPITQLHGVQDRLDYHSPRLENRKPYTYFEEAFPGVVSTALTESDIWHIHRRTQRRWGAARNDMNPEDERNVAS